jgi:hypothetical protein
MGEEMRIKKYRLPRDYSKMPIGFYLRLGKDGRLHCLGQKSEIDPDVKRVVIGPIEPPTMETEDYEHAGVKPLWPKKKKK